MENNLGIIDTRFCEKSEFSNDKWLNHTVNLYY